VPAHVLPQTHQLTVGGEQSGRVQTSGSIEDLLAGTQPLRQSVERGRVDPDRIVGDGVPGQGAYGVDAGLAADAAGAGRVEVPGRIDRRRRDPFGEDHFQDVEVGVAAVLGGRDVRRAADQALGEQEPERQVDIVARGTHGHRERAAVDPDFQWLLGDQGVGTAYLVAVDDAYHDAPVCHAPHAATLRRLGPMLVEVVPRIRGDFRDLSREVSRK